MTQLLMFSLILYQIKYFLLKTGMNELIKSKIQWKNGIYKNYQNSSKMFADLETLQNTISEVSKLTYEKKNDYYHQLARKLIDPTTSCRTYWSILKTFYNNKKNTINTSFTHRK